ncbi:uncharacterized protein LODBEIA_P22540 [Lodderomyces beijingensis]|uniref:Uncharacterized protein n=1 Tax=Lodderomyces beijingensis TaxID=1775926 RepID=A0ABP0ZLG4_9ASCO
MPPQSFKQHVVTNLRLVCLLLIPILAILYIIPTFITPELADNFHTNFKIVLLTKEWCQVKPWQCAVLNEDYGDPSQLLKIRFHHYDVIYVVHKNVALWDDFVINVLMHRNPMISLLRRSWANEQDEAFWGKFEESLRIANAMVNVMVFHSIWGIVFSKMWMFFVFGIAVTVLEPWERLAGPLWTILQEANTVF